MTEDELKQIEARVAATSPRPWRPNVYWNDGAWPTGPYSRNEKQARADAEFIAHARGDVPELVAEVRRLRAASDRSDAVDPDTAIGRRVAAMPPPFENPPLPPGLRSPAEVRAVLIEHYQGVVNEEIATGRLYEEEMERLYAENEGVARFVELRRLLDQSRIRRDAAAVDLGMTHAAPVEP